jgi:uncharacterized membrane protein (DUF373 family)
MESWRGFPIFDLSLLAFSLFPAVQGKCAAKFVFRQSRILEFEGFAMKRRDYQEGSHGRRFFPNKFSMNLAIRSSTGPFRMSDFWVMKAKDSSPGSDGHSDAPLSLGARFVDRGEELIYIVVAGLLLVTAAVTCGYAALSAISSFQLGNPLQGIFSLVNDLLLVLIIMEVLRTVARFLRKRELNVDVEDLVPFLVIGGISAARRILAIGANLSLNEAQHVEHQAGNIGASVNWDRFNQAMIELGVDAGLIIVITLALLIIHRYTLQRG